MLKRVLPFLDWFEFFNRETLRTDLIAGITVALVLIPQSMAYAQLAGMPAHYGLYAAFLPPMIAALFGSSRQLATGPVAVVSLMTAATLEPLATAGSEGYIAYAVFLALMVGLFQLALGLLRLGVLVNFLSHPVVNGFTNAAAIIIATSQLSKIFGVYVDKAEHHYETVARVVVDALHFTHWPTFLLAALSFGIMYGLKRLNPKIPYVLVAVAITTLISWGTGFEHDHHADLSAIAFPTVHDEVAEFNASLDQIDALAAERAEHTVLAAQAAEQHGSHSVESTRLHQEVEVIGIQLEQAKERAHIHRHALRSFHFDATEGADGLRFFPEGQPPPGEQTDGRHWRIKVGDSPIDHDAVHLIGGGAVVGVIPAGLPAFALPELDLSLVSRFLVATVIISLLGFMEAISIAKAMAARTGQRLDPNQELIGQGLANILGAVGQSYPVSGSFSRSAVNLQAGAVTGLSSVVTSAMVLVTLLLFTPLLYHLPQSVLASVIMMAVIGLINVSGFTHAWKANRADGVIAVVSFLATLAFAPHLDRGILIGVLLSIGMYLHRGMRPDVVFLSRFPDGSFRDAERWGLRRCEHILVVRFNGSLFFANTSHLESKILEAVSQMPKLRHVIIVGNGINSIDASGEEIISQLVDRLFELGHGLTFTGLNDNITDVLKRTLVYEKVGEENFWPSVAMAIEAISDRVCDGPGTKACPLRHTFFVDDDTEEKAMELLGTPPG